MIDIEAIEAEANAVRQRSHELVQLLDASAPVVDRAPIRVVRTEAASLAAAARAARTEVAVKIAAGQDPGCPVGREPPIRRVRATPDGRPDGDPILRGRSCVTSQLVAYFEHQRDTVGPTIEAAYRQAVADQPYRPALLAACRGHLAVLYQRQSTAVEGADELLAAITTYESAYANLREGISDGQQVATAATARLTALEREAAAAVIGDDETVISGLIASAQVAAMPDEVVDAKTGRPIGVT